MIMNLPDRRRRVDLKMGIVFGLSLLAALLMAGPVAALTLEELQGLIPVGSEIAESTGFRVQMSIDDSAVVRSYVEYWRMPSGVIAVVNYMDSEAVSCRFYMPAPPAYRCAFPLRVDHLSQLYRNGDRFFGLIDTMRWSPEISTLEEKSDGLMVTCQWTDNNRTVYHFSATGWVPLKIEKFIGTRYYSYEIEQLPAGKCPDIIFDELARIEN